MATTRNKQVGWIEYSPAQIKIPLIYDNKEKTFHANYAGTTFHNVAAGELEGTVLTAIKDSLQISWQGLITIHPTNKSSYNTALTGFELERSFVAPFPKIGYKTVHWGCPIESRMQASRPFPWNETIDGPFTLPRTQRHHELTTYYHAYSEILWDHLQELQGHLRQIHTRILDALHTEEGITALSTLGFLTLLHTTSEE